MSIQKQIITWTLALLTKVVIAQQAWTQGQICDQLHNVDSTLKKSEDLKNNFSFDLNLRGGMNYDAFRDEYTMFKLNAEKDQLNGRINPPRDSVWKIIRSNDRDSIIQKLNECKLSTSKKSNVTLSKIDFQTLVASVRIRAATKRKNSISKLFLFQFDIHNRLLDVIETDEIGLNTKDQLELDKSNRKLNNKD